MSSLPKLGADATAHSHALLSVITEEISANGGWLSFERLMQLVLYQPTLGYYSGGAQKFGIGGDFVTAPEISPLFAKCVAQQAAQILQETKGDVLELGAGTGQLAYDLLTELQALNQLPKHYYILEVSEYLRGIQQEKINKLAEHLIEKVIWLDRLPEAFEGLIFANEVLDALPVSLVKNTIQGLVEVGVRFENAQLVWAEKPINAGALFEYSEALNLPVDYQTEVCLSATGLVNSLSECLHKGAVLLVDYGFGRAEYYHPQRHEGTLMCHFQHYAHSDPLINLGLQDVTSHVNFTQIAEAGLAAGCELAGYTNQAYFLINCGLTEILSQTSADDIAQYLPLTTSANKLISPAEMGDLFKVIGLTKNLPIDLIGFATGDKTHML